MRVLSLFRPAQPMPDGSRPDPEQMARMGAFIENQTKAGHLVMAGPVGRDAEGALVRQAGGEIVIDDGAQAKGFSGFAILQGENKAEIMGLVREFLALAGDGVCEVHVMAEM